MNEVLETGPPENRFDRSEIPCGREVPAPLRLGVREGPLPKASLRRGFLTGSNGRKWDESLREDGREHESDFGEKIFYGGEKLDSDSVT